MRHRFPFSRNPDKRIQAAELIKVKLDDGEVSTGKLHIGVSSNA